MGQASERPTVGFPDVPRFEKLKRLGEGGMGVVYKAYDREYETTVALKVLRFSDTGQDIQRFKNEFRYLQSVRHPNLVRFFELMNHDGQWFFTMEFVDGVNFLEWVRPPSLEAQKASAKTIPLSELSTEASSSDDATVAELKRQFQEAQLLEAQLQETLKKQLQLQKIMRQKVSAKTIPLAELNPQPAVMRGPGALTTGILDENRLREALRQLTRGLVYLHSAERIHRDIKPDNIIVTPNGRLALLDFGLTSYHGATSEEVLGTPLYVAPEIASRRAVGPESDWYSVGVMLYEALTKEQLFYGSDASILRRKQARVSGSLAEKFPEIDQSLDALCAGLLEPDPKKRPSVDRIISLLGVQVMPRTRRRSHLPVESPLIGRIVELGILQHAFATVQRGEAQSIYVHGESGMGKSELVREFCRGMEGDCTVLAGQCYEREAVPYKAVDGIVDALATVLKKMKGSDVREFMPQDADLLLLAFPVLKQVKNFARLAPAQTANTHPAELRARVFVALRSLLGEYAKQEPLILTIDDLQWADRDSLDLLKALMRTPNAPGIMLVATIKTPSKVEDREALNQRLAVIDDVKQLTLGPLASEHAEQLVRRLSDEVGGISVDPKEIVAEAGGHPFFIEVLIRYCYNQGRTGGVSLSEVLSRHIGALQSNERKLLEVLSVAGRPIPRAIAAKAIGVSLAQLRQSFDILQSEKLLRGDGVRNTDTIEPYHYRVREVGRVLPAETVVAYYRALAATYEEENTTDPEVLSGFWEGAGELGKAAQYAESAAESAIEVLAHERASSMYRQAIRLRKAADLPLGHLQEKLASALEKSGRGSEAADAYMLVAKSASTEDALEFRRRAAEQLLRCGRIDEGIAIMEGVLVAHGFKIPKTRNQILRSFLWERAMLAMRPGGLRFKSTPESEIDPKILNRLDACWAGATGLFNVDQLRGLGLHCKHLRLALAVGEPMRISRALALEASSLSAVGKSPARVRHILDIAGNLSNSIDDPLARAWVNFNHAAFDYLRGEWKESTERCDRTIELLKAECSGANWEIQTLEMLKRWSLAFQGELGTVTEEVATTLSYTQQSDDLYGELGVCSGLPNISYLFLDKPGEARRVSSDAISRWTQKGFHLQHLLDLYAQVQIDLYEGLCEQAWLRVCSDWPQITDSGLMQVAFNRILMLDIRGRAGLAHYSKNGDEKARVVAKKAAKGLQKESYTWSKAFGLLLEGQLTDLSSRYESAAVLFDTCGMQLHFGIARSLATGSDAIQVLVDANVISPPRFLQMLLPHCFVNGGDE